MSIQRYEELKRILQERRCFKLVCGAGNEDREEVRKLSTVYTLAGATILDLSANIDVVRSAKAGVANAYNLAPFLKKEIKTRPYLNVSIGIKGDPHVRKAKIDASICARCARCLKACRQETIREDYTIEENRCIGCGDCETVCESGAVKFIHKRADFDRVLPKAVEIGAEMMELHAVSEDDDAVLRDWRLLNRIIPNNFLSMCLDRLLLSNRRFAERVKQAYEITGERLIIQADGVPMGGVGDDYNTTLQAIACADIVQKSGVPVMIFLSGGTNSKTGILARQCGVNANGVAVGTFARKIVKEFIKRDDFDSDRGVLGKAVSTAEELIQSNIKAIND